MNDIVKWKKLFIKFLKKEKVLGQYIKNTELAKRFGNDEMIRLCHKNNQNQFINQSFTWSDTKEGHKFWCKLHDKWVDFVRWCKSDGDYKKKKRTHIYMPSYYDWEILT